MADKELKIKITVDKNTGAVSIVDGEFNKLSDTVSSTEKSIKDLNAQQDILRNSNIALQKTINNLNKEESDYKETKDYFTKKIKDNTIASKENAAQLKEHKDALKELKNNTDNTSMSLGEMASKIGLFYIAYETFKDTIGKVLTDGFSYNKQLEDSSAGLTALTVATSSNISAMGNHLSITEKYYLAQKEAISTTAELNKINTETTRSLAENAQIYKSLYATMKDHGASNAQMVTMTKELSIASSSAGIQMHALLAGVDGLATGTVLANSDLGRFLGSIGLTNDKLKESKDVAGLVIDKLKDFKVLDTMTVATSQLSNAWNQFTGELTKDYFEHSKDSIKELTSLLNGTTTALKNLKIEWTAEINIKGVDDYKIKLSQLEADLKEAKKNAAGAGWFPKDAYIQESKLIEGQISLLKERFEFASKSTVQKDTLVKKEKDPQQTYEQWKALELKKKDVTTATDEELKKIYEARYKDEEAKAKKAITEMATRTKEWATESIKISANLAAAQMDAQNKPYIDLLAKYDEEVLKFGKVQGAKEKLAEAYNAELEKLNKASLQKSLENEDTLAAMGFKIFEENEAKKLALTNESIDTSMNHMQSMLDMQISLAESAKDWTNNLSGQAGNIADISKAMDAMRVLDMKSTKTNLQLQEDYAKAFLSANGDIVKEKEASVRFDEGNAQLKDELNRQEINGYATLAGAMSQSFSKGSDAAMAFMAIQQSLSLYNGVTAVLGAWASAPFPANLPAVASTTVAVAALLAQVGQSFSGSGGGSSAPTEDFAANKALIEANYNPITDRLDRQISLLESIDRKGSSSSLGISKSSSDFEKNYKLWVEDTLQKARIGSVNSKMSVAELNQVVDAIEVKSGVNTFTTTQSNGLNANNIGYISLNTDILREGYNLISALQTAQGGYTGTLGQAGMHGTQAEMNAQVQASIADSLNKAQGLVNDWAMGIIGSMDDLESAAKDFKNYYDDVTGSMFYQTDTLKKAFDDVDKLRGASSFADYLKTQITDITSLQTFFTNETFTLLSSTNANDIQAQINKVAELGVKTGQTFTGGAEEALNYLESIGLVAKAMADSRQNIKSWEDSFKTPTQLAQDMASTLGVALATSLDDLNTMFSKLSTDTDGLTNADLALLNANKDLLTSTGQITQAVASVGKTMAESTSLIEADILNQYQNQITLSEAFKTASNSIQSFRDDLLKIPLSFESVMSGISSITSAEDASKILSGIQGYYNQETSALSTSYAARIELLNTQSALEKESLNSKISLLENEKDILRGFKDYADGIKISQLQDSYSTAALLSKFNATWSDMSLAVAHGDKNAADLGSRTQTYATNYLDSLKNTASKSDYTFEQNKIASLFSSFEGTGNVATLDTIKLSLESLDSNLGDSINKLKEDEKTALESLKSKTLSALNTLEYATRAIAPDLSASFSMLNATAIGYLNIDSPIVGWLKTLDASVNNISFDGYKTATNTTAAYATANNSLISSAYSDVLGRTADAAGAAYWNAQLSSGAVSISNLKTAIAMGAQANDLSAAKNWLVNGSHANGLSRVPFDGYIAELHKDERVLTADETKSYERPIFVNTQENILIKVLNEIKELKNTIASLQAKNNNSTEQIVKNTKKPLLEYKNA
ncbi:MAG: DUF4214 domain-containing protein [Campylobacterales bacterium]|nr:DUF4214 domain-containing protein [Campylobacterales bacterium]